MANESGGDLFSMVTELDGSDVELKGWDKQFIADIIDRDLRVFSEKQAAQIRRIWYDKIEGGS